LYYDSNSTVRCLLRIILFVLTPGTALFFAACAPIQGFPSDPENTDATLTGLQPYFDGSVEQQYLAAGDDNVRTQIRNELSLEGYAAMT